MPFIVGRAAREHELYTRFKDFVTGVGFLGRATFSGSGNGKLIDPRLTDLAYGAETYTLTCVSTADKGGSFGVVSSLRGTLADTNVNQVYVDPRVQFYLDFGSTNFSAGDSFTLKFLEYSAAAKPKLSAVRPTTGTKTELITLTCTQAGQHEIPTVQAQIPAVFSVSGSVSGSLGSCTQGAPFTSTAVTLTIDRGDISNASIQFSVGDTIKVHTTENPLRPLNQQWSVLRQVTTPANNQFGTAIPESDIELILEGPGLTGTDEIQVGIRRSWSNASARANWELSGQRGYAAGLTFDEQPSILPLASRPYFNTWSGELPYWISVTGRKITMKVRNNNYYMDLYLGLGIPWGSPKYQPYFLCVGGSSGRDEPNWTNLSVSNSNYWGSRNASYELASMQFLARNGVWTGSLARANNSRLDDWNGGGWIQSSNSHLWPFRGNGMQKVGTNLDGSTPLLPVAIGPTYGELEGICAVSGFGNLQPEDLVWSTTDQKKYVVGTNTYRNSVEDFCAMELI